MKRTVPFDTFEEMKDFPYHGHGWGYNGSREFLDSLLYTIDDPETPDGMMYVMDIDGMRDWYDQVADEEERAQYECPTIYDYIACEIGRYVTPLKGWWKE